MTTTFPGLYRAKAVKLDGTKLTAQIPQVYGEATVIVSDFVGAMPTAVGMGWVSFHAGDAAFPVWHGSGGGTTSASTLIAAYWRYHNTSAAPPGSGEIRTSSPVTTVWLSKTDDGGFNRASGTSQVKEGDTLQLKGSDGSVFILSVSGTPVDNGTYWTYPVTVVSGSEGGKKGTIIEVALVITAGGGGGGTGPPGVGVPPGGTTDQVLAKIDGADYNTEWITPVGEVPATRSIGTTAPLTGGGDLSANRSLAITAFAGSVPGAVPTSPGGAVNFLRADGTWAMPPGGGGGIAGITVKEGGVSAGTAFTSLLFTAAGFDITAAGAEATIILDLTEYTGGALPIAGGGTGATSAAAALTALGAASTTALTTHASTTTNVHGIVDTAALVTLAGTQTLTGKTLALGSNTVSGTIAQFNTAVTDADIATTAALAAHEADTTAIHGIADTSLLETSASAAAKVAAHEADTTAIHGIADTALLVTLAGIQVLTGKTLTLGTNTVTGTTAQFNTALTDNDFATLNGAETLLNKIIDLTFNTLSGTASQFNAANTDSDFYTTGGVDVSVADGGTGRSTSSTANGVIAAGTTATGAFQTILPGTTGQFLKSAGASVPGAFAAIVTADVTNLDTTLSGLQTNKADKTIAITATSPITGGGTLAAAFSIGINAASTTVIGAARLSTVAEAVSVSPLATVAVTPAALVAGYLQLVGGSLSGSLNITAGALNFGTRSGQHINLSATSHAIGVQGAGGAGQNSVFFRAASSFWWYKGGVADPATGVAGLGGTPLMSLDDATISGLMYRTYRVWHEGNQGHTVNSTGINADMLDSKHGAAFADREEMEALLGDLLYVGTYDAAGYMPPNRYIPFNGAVPNTITGCTIDAPTDAAIDFRCDCTVPSVGAGVNQRPINGLVGFNFTNTTIYSFVRASDATFPTVQTAYPVAGTGWAVGARVQLRGVWNPTTDSITHYWRLSTGVDLLSDPVIPFTVTTKALTNNVATLTLSTTHTFAVDDLVYVTNVDLVFDGRYKVTATTATTLSYVKINPNVTSVATATGTAGIEPLNPNLWIQLGTPVVAAGKLLTETPTVTAIGGAASFYYTGRFFRFTAALNGTATFDLRGSDPTTTVGTYTVTTKALTANVATLTVALVAPATSHTLAVGNSIKVVGVDAVFDGFYTITAKTAATISYARTNADVVSAATPITAIVGPPVPVSSAVTPFPASLGGPTMAMVGTGMLRLDLRPDPDWSQGATVYRHGLYWVCNSTGTVDFVTTDASGRYPTENPNVADEQIGLKNGDWVIALIPGYTVTNKSLTTNVATLTVAMPVTTPATAKHTLLVGAVIDVALTPPDVVFDGAYTITAITPTTVSYAKTNADVTAVAAGGLVSGQTLDQVVFQYVPFSTETFVKNQIAAHLAAEDPHSQYLLPAEADEDYAPVVHRHDAEIRQNIIEHVDVNPWSVTAWSWAGGIVTLTVPPKEGIPHNITPLASFNLSNIHDELNKKWPVLDAELGANTVRFSYATQPAGYTVPVDLTGNPGSISSDPHAQYLEVVEANLLYSKVDHLHTGIYEPAGAVLAHEAHPDPHTVAGYLTKIAADSLFLTPAEGDIAYALSGHTHPEILEVHATDGANSADIWVGDTQPTFANGVQVGDLWFETAPIGLQVPTMHTLTVSNGSVTTPAVVLSWQQWAASELLSSISLERSLTGAVPWVVVTTDKTLTTITDSTALPLVANTIYYYRIKAINAASAAGGSYSPTVSIVTKPANVTGVNAASSGATNATVTWVAPPGGAYSYDVYVNSIFKINQTALSYSATGVTENTSYAFGIRAKGSTGLYGTTVSDSITSLNAAPADPGTPTIGSIDHDSAVVNWPASSSSDIRDYEVFLGTTSKGFVTGLTYTFTGLSASTSYTFRVRARDTRLAYSSPDATSSPFVTRSTTAPPDTTPPTAPTIQSLEPETSYGNMVVRYTLGTGTTQYRIDSSTNNSTWTIEVNWTAGTPAGSVGRTLGGYAAGTTVYCRVYARDAALNTTYTNATPYTLIASPTYVTATATNHWRATNGGSYNAMGNNRAVQGYFSNSAYNAVGMWYYGTKPKDTLYYSGRRKITAVSIYLKREDGGASVGLDTSLWLHSKTTNPGSVINTDPTLTSTLVHGTTFNSNLQWEAPAGTTVALTAAWGQELVDGIYKGVAIYRADGSQYMTLSTVAEDSLSGRLTFTHLG